MMERRAVVRALKFGLPALALAVFGSLFVFSSARYSGGVSFDGVDVSSLREGLRLQNPRFTGATKAGEPFSIQRFSSVFSRDVKRRSLANSMLEFTGFHGGM